MLVESLFTFQPKQLIGIHSDAQEQLEVGGVRSGKTTGKLMYGVQAYCMAFAKCDMSRC